MPAHSECGGVRQGCQKGNAPPSRTSGKTTREAPPSVTSTAHAYSPLAVEGLCVYVANTSQNLLQY